ncbi:cupin domain-containing protein [Microlunatus aurantiacus]|uniref:Cupin domain-containing protein n=1 Tax=Microlunatus aurantiacus TaxID=446786 RepID=A0ABP7CKX9_9ACTN
MPVIHAPTAPTHTLAGTTFTSLATPSRGSTSDTSVWRVSIAPGTKPTPHALTREEIFVVLTGSADVTIDVTQASAGAGDAIVVPPGVPFSLANPGDDPLELLCCLPVGGQARLDDGTLLTPPWAQ